MTTISLLSLWFYRSCVCTVVLTSTFFSNSRHRGIIARKTWESQISLTNSKIPWLFSKFQISLTNYKIPWLFPDLEFPWLFPDQWQPWYSRPTVGVDTDLPRFSWTGFLKNWATDEKCLARQKQLKNSVLDVTRVDYSDEIQDGIDKLKNGTVRISSISHSPQQHSW